MRTHSRLLLIVTKNDPKGNFFQLDLSFNNHVKTITKSAFYHLTNIAKCRGLMSKHDLEKLIHAFISSRVGYCNGLVTGLLK